MAAARLARELGNLSAVAWGTVSPMGDDITQWQIVVAGPDGTPYEGGQFQLKAVFPKDYPAGKPEVVFQTKIFHPSVDPSNGAVCLKALKDWLPATTMSDALSELIEILKTPHADHPFNAEAGALFASNVDEFNKVAAEWTAEHAAP